MREGGGGGSKEVVRRQRTVWGSVKGQTNINHFGIDAWDELDRVGKGKGYRMGAVKVKIEGVFGRVVSLIP